MKGIDGEVFRCVQTEILIGLEMSRQMAESEETGW